MSQKRFIVSAATLGLVMILFWGCQNSKPVGPMKYVSLNATISTKGLVKPRGVAITGSVELLYRITGPSMNPVTGAVTFDYSSLIETPSANKSISAPVSAVNFTVNIPAGPSRVLAVQANFLQGMAPALADPINVYGIGATSFDVDPGTKVVDVPVTIGLMCGDCCWYSGECFHPGGGWSIAYMGNTDLVNCAFVPLDKAFFYNSCDAKNYVLNGNQNGPTSGIAREVSEGPNVGLKSGDVYCINWNGSGHTWCQFGDDGSGELFVQYRVNNTLPYYAYQNNGCGNPDVMKPTKPGSK